MRDAKFCVSTGCMIVEIKMEKFKGKYRIASNRLQNWDYGSNAYYFVTICTQNRKCYFGDIQNNNMQLSPIGHIVNSCWHEIPNHFPFIELDAHTIMPNNLHGIIIIDKPNNEQTDGHDDVETQNLASLPKPYKNQFAPQSKNLASVIRGFKIGVTKNAQQMGIDFAWQSNYYDHIIRDDQSHQKISNYIINNPTNWNEDKFNPKNNISTK